MSLCGLSVRLDDAASGPRAGSSPGGADAHRRGLVVPVTIANWFYGCTYRALLQRRSEISTYYNFFSTPAHMRSFQKVISFLVS